MTEQKQLFTENFTLKRFSHGYNCLLYKRIERKTKLRRFDGIEVIALRLSFSLFAGAATV